MRLIGSASRGQHRDRWKPIRTCRDATGRCWLASPNSGTVAYFTAIPPSAFSGGEASGAPGPGGHSRVATAARIVPGTGERIAILAERAFVVSRGIPLAHPDGECVVLDLVGVVQRLAFGETVVARPAVRAGLLTVLVLVTDDLQTLVAAEVDMLQQKEPAFGPLVDN